MLRSLAIQNLATIKSVDMQFEPGFNALTGETGAGKSILIAGLELVLGERASSQTIRAGARLTVVEARFEPPFPRGLPERLADELQIEWSASEPLTIRREITAGGRNRCFFNDQMVNVAALKTLGEALVDFHGQHEHQSLFHAESHRDALDAFAAHDKLLDEYRRAWESVAHLRRRRRELDEAARDFESRVDYLDFQLAEIECLDPQPGELDALAQEEKRLAHAETLAQSAAAGYQLLYEGGDDPTAIGLVGEVARRIEAIAEYDETFAAALDRIEDVRANLEDLAWQLRDAGERFEADPVRLNDIIERLEALRALVRKHGGSEQALFKARETMQAEREQMSHDDAERREIESRLAAAEKTLNDAARRLSESRRAAAARFGQAVARLLRELNMERARFEVAIEPLDSPGPHGADRVEFLLTANPGLPPAPLRKVGSGGEISRVMLALKSVLAARDCIPTLVFDEIDVGLSGETARKVGRLMEDLAASHQLIVITHHAAIAARAGAHWVVRKSTRRGETFTETEPIVGDPRLDELAGMMGGDAATASARDLARQLMD